jgi:hypothetical protein
MIAAGYEDCDDVDASRTDPALKIAVGRAPENRLTAEVGRITSLCSYPWILKVKP